MNQNNENSSNKNKKEMQKEGIWEAFGSVNEWVVGREWESH